MTQVPWNGPTRDSRGGYSRGHKNPTCSSSPMRNAWSCPENIFQKKGSKCHARLGARWREGWKVWDTLGSAGAESIVLRPLYCRWVFLVSTNPRGGESQRQTAAEANTRRRSTSTSHLMMKHYLTDNLPLPFPVPPGTIYSLLQHLQHLPLGYNLIITEINLLSNSNPCVCRVTCAASRFTFYTSLCI